MEARNRSLSDWFTRIRTRQLVLPRFQRFEAWTYRHVVGLLDTVLRELPAGALLILEIGDEQPFVSRPMVGAPESGDRISEHLLDGQQRLTALWRSLTDDYADRTYLIDASPDGDEALESNGPRAVSYARWDRNGQLYPLWLNDPKAVWERELIPVSLLRPDPSAETAFREWVKEATAGDLDQMMGLFQLGTELRGKFAQFNLPFLSLPPGTSAETALDVFVKMNTSAQPLSTYDIVVAQVEAGTGHSLHELVEELKKQAPSLELFADPADVILGASAYLQDRPARRGVMLGEGFARTLIDQWDVLVRGARRASSFLVEEGVFDAARLPTDPVVPLLVALWAHAPEGLDREGEARLTLRRLLWRSFFTDRYERASNTRTLADFRAVREQLAGGPTDHATIFDDMQFAPPSVEELLVAGWPKKKERLARAILLVSLKNGGLDLADGAPATRESILRREYHHLFPVAYLKEQSIAESEIFKALNCALITWRTNRHISAKAPADYIRQRADASSLGESEIRRRLSSHLIDYDLLTAGDYSAFVSARAEVIRDAAVELC